MITIEQIKNIAKDIKEDKEWVNDSHTYAEHKGVVNALDRLIRHLQETQGDNERIREIVSNIFFEFMLEIEDTKLYEEYIIPTKEGTESTEKASKLFYRIEEHIENLYE